ncbi:MAG: ribokinase [Culicoidibacterales bacterium]
MAKITVVGSLNSDLSICTTQLPKMGETLMGSDFQMLPGGKGLNQATAAALLGSEVELVGSVGDDAFGQSLLSFLASKGVKTDGVQVNRDVPTGCAVIPIFDGDNSIILAAGANGTVSASDIAVQAQTIATSKALIMQLEIPMPAIMQALAIANQHHVPVVFNPAPMQSLSSELLAQIETIVVNEHECEQLTGIMVETDEQAQTAITWFQAQGIQTAIITLGSRGVYFNVEQHIQFLPAQKVHAIDTTGAGDTFIGAYTTAKTQGQSVQVAVAFAITASAITVTRRGAASAMPTRAELRE